MEKETNQERILEERNENQILEKSNTNSYLNEIKKAIITKPATASKIRQDLKLKAKAGMDFQSKRLRKFQFSRAGKTKIG